MRVFLSHSNKDKKFVRRLHESLIWNGIDTFFDEKDIKVGDNIPTKIERGIAESAHLIYVLSANSINSLWVNEELSMAKIKAKIESGFKVVPVLIEDLILPVGIAHIKYANFIGWEYSEKYYDGLSELLDGIGAKRKGVEVNTTSFSLKNYQLLSNLERTSWRYGTFLDGMVDGYFEGLPGTAITVVRDMAVSRYRSLDVQEYLDEVENLLQTMPSDTFVELRKLMLESKDRDLSGGSSILDPDFQAWNNDLADKLYKQRDLFYKIAGLLRPMILDATMQIVTSMDFVQGKASE
jgi:hypothetical protein